MKAEEYYKIVERKIGEYDAHGFRKNIKDLP